MDFESRALSYEHSHATHLAQFHSDFHVGRQEAVLNRASVGLKTLNNLLQRVGDSQQPGWEFLGCRCSHGATFNQAVATAIALDDAPTSCLAAWINSKDAHNEAER